MPAYNLLIDIGNTFLKWGLFRADARRQRAREPRRIRPCAARGNHRRCRRNSRSSRRPRRSSFPTSPAPASRSDDDPHRSKSGRMRRRRTGSIPQQEQCGVTNGYRNPAQLGSDRWAALIGRTPSAGCASAALVVVCGTATTIDFLSADGVFKGGVILPGVGLMLRSLHDGTAALPEPGRRIRRDYPTQTVDAIASGCQHAQAGAIERLYHLQCAQQPDADLPAVRRCGARAEPAADDSLRAAGRPRARRTLPHQPRRSTPSSTRCRSCTRHPRDRSMIAGFH